jgi:hypothetical protein
VLKVYKTIPSKALPAASNGMPSSPSNGAFVTVCLVGERRRGSAAEPTLILRTDPTFSSLVGNIGFEWLRPSFCLVGGMRIEIDGNFHPVSGSTCHRLRVQRVLCVILILLILILWL